MPLLDLPDEILLYIIKYSLPYGFESFVLTCKRIYAVGEEDIPNHNRLRRTYKDFQYNKEIRCALQLLQRIANDPLIAEYIEEAHLHAVDEYYDWEDAEQHKVHDESNIQDITRFVRNSIYFRKLPLNMEGLLENLQAFASSRHSDAVWCPFSLNAYVY
jgi:hypothetical protein